MNASHTHRRAHGSTQRRGHDTCSPSVSRRAFDWAGQIKLAIVLSVIAAIAASALADRVDEPVLIVGIIVIASFAAWARVEPAAEPARVQLRRR